MNTPPLPSLQQLTRMLTETGRAFAHPDCGPGSVALYCEGAGWPDAHWTVGCFPEDWPHAKLFEDVPGRGLVGTFNAIGAARRLLAAARDAEF